MINDIFKKRCDISMNTEAIFRKAANWGELNTQLAASSPQDKGDCFEILTKYFLQLHPNYITKLSKVWLLKEVPAKIHKHLNLPGPDEGIDLIAETKEGEYWAIQCKYKTDENKSLTRKELSTFTDLAFNICRGISLCLICTTADRFSYKLKRYGERLTFCAGDIWRGLDKEFFQRLHCFIDGKLSLPKPLTPRPHQERAIANAYRHFVKEGNRRGKLIMPCGTGKSLAAYWIAEKLNAQKILVAVPSLALIRQTLEVWTRESLAHHKEVNWICVCSDTSVGDISKEDIAVLVQDLGVEVHTDPNAIADWLRLKKSGLTIVFTTYQSGKAVSEASRKAGINFDIGIMDEAHKTVGQRGGLFSYLLEDKNIVIKNRVFMTATERRYAGQSEHILSMDDPEQFGDTFELLTFKEALNCKPPILSDYKIVTMAISRSEIEGLIQANAFVRPDKGRWDREVEAEMLASVIALRKAMQKRPIRHAVSFHSSIARAKAFKDTQDKLGEVLPGFGELESFHVSGNIPTAVRSHIIEEFESSERSLITNARCLTEGVDVPNIDCVLFADPRKSAVDIVQAVGRALRPSEGKKFGYVVIPILLDKELVDSQSVEKSPFDIVLTTLRALAANDDRIIDYFRAIANRNRRLPSRDNFQIDIPDGIKINVDEFIRSIEIKIWSKLARLSWRPFEEARTFVHKLGLKNRGEWDEYCKGNLKGKGKKPDDIPANPNQTYKDTGWVSMGDWLGTGYIAHGLREYRTYKKARKYVYKLGLKSHTEWLEYCKGTLKEKGKKPDDIPSDPSGTYKDIGWLSYGDWLGTGAIAPRLRKYRPYREARKFVHKLGLKSVSEWREYSKGNLKGKGKRPDAMPSHPGMVYKNAGWKSWGDWLGTGTIAPRLRKYRPYQEARKLVHGLKLKNQTEWNEYCKGNLQGKGKKPDDIPATPIRNYTNKGWISWGDWLGTGSIAPWLRKYRPYREARKFVRKLGLKSHTEWLEYCKGNLQGKGKKPDDIPSNSDSTYKETGWISWGDWLRK
jgi:superfamily II DNA or RNA helicase